MKALVLTGGGARGAFEAGVMYALKDTPWDIVCGTSAGAINGAFAAQDMYEELKAVWSTIGSKKVLQMVPAVAHAKQFITDVEDALRNHRYAELFTAVGEFMKIGPLGTLLKTMGAIDPNPITQILGQYVQFDKLRRTFVVTATNVTTQTADTFYYIPDAAARAAFAGMVKPGKQRYALTADNYLNAVHASTSIPGAFPPVVFAPGGGPLYQYVDGGVANNTPLGMAVDAGADDITIVFMDPVGVAGTAQQANSLVDVGVACFSVMQSKILEDDLKLAIKTNQAVAGAADKERRQVRLSQIRPAQPLAVTVLDFDKQDLMDAAFSAGLVAAQNPQPANG